MIVLFYLLYFFYAPFNLLKTFQLNADFCLTSASSRFFWVFHFSSCLFLSLSFLISFILDPHNHSTVEKIPLTKVGRCIYRVRHEESGVERSIVCQIDTVEGSKMITIRSPVQVIIFPYIIYFFSQTKTILWPLNKLFKKQAQNTFFFPFFPNICCWIFFSHR